MPALPGLHHVAALTPHAQSDPMYSTSHNTVKVARAYGAWLLSRGHWWTQRQIK